MMPGRPTAAAKDKQETESERMSMRTMRVFFGVALLLVAGGSACSKSSSPTEPTTVAVRFTLNSVCALNSTTSVDIFIDNVFQGNIQRGQSITVNTKPGNHNLGAGYYYTDRAPAPPGAGTTITVPAGGGSFNIIC
jgi:spore coat protein U-like protein